MRRSVPSPSLAQKTTRGSGVRPPFRTSMSWLISKDASRSLVLGGLHSVVCALATISKLSGLSALTLLVARIGADHHDPPMPTDHPALVADRLDARVHLHGLLILFCLLVGWLSGLLLVSVHNAAPGQVVGRQLHHHPVLGQDADVVLPHLAADVGKHLVTILQLNTEHRIGQGLDHPALDLDGAVLLGHNSLKVLVV